jgi:hypothetical protein
MRVGAGEAAKVRALAGTLAGDEKGHLGCTLGVRAYAG